jgi:hypothetical protein
MIKIVRPYFKGKKLFNGGDFMKRMLKVFSLGALLTTPQLGQASHGYPIACNIGARFEDGRHHVIGTSGFAAPGDPVVQEGYLFDLDGVYGELNVYARFEGEDLFFVTILQVAGISTYTEVDPMSLIGLPEPREVLFISGGALQFAHPGLSMLDVSCGVID